MKQRNFILLLIMCFCLGAFFMWVFTLGRVSTLKKTVNCLSGTIQHQGRVQEWATKVYGVDWNKYKGD